jgi:hypothetical protein
VAAISAPESALTSPVSPALTSASRERARLAPRPQLLGGREEEGRGVVPEERRPRHDVAGSRRRRGEGGDRTREEDEVGVRQKDEASAGDRDPRVQAPGIAEVPGGRQHPVGDARERPGLVAVARVDDDDGLRDVARTLDLLAKRGDRPRGERCGAVGDDDDGDHAC